MARKQIMVGTMLALVLSVLSACAAAPSADVASVVPTPNADEASPVPTPRNATAPTQLRIVNTSTTALDQLVVIFPNEHIDFGAIPAGATTEFQPVAGGVYRYAAYRVTIDGRLETQPVIDWLGEQPLSGTACTYSLSIDMQRAFSPRLPFEAITSEVNCT